MARTSRESSLLRGLPAFGFAAAGLLLGHTVSYALVVPDPHRRDLLLERTGHGYLPAAGEAAMMLVLAGVAAVLIRAWSSRGRGERARTSSIAGTLALVQGCAFLGLELLERAIVGAPSGDPVGDLLLPIGLAVQVAVAVLGAAVLVALARTSTRLVRSASARRTAILRPAPALPIQAVTGGPAARIVVSTRNVRGPPSR